jgi:hypothetical protein
MSATTGLARNACSSRVARAMRWIRVSFILVF